MDATLILGVLNVVAVNLVLSGDNAMVIALAIRRLPPALAKRAALVGALGAVLLRLVFTFGAVKLLALPLLQAAGGLVLMAIAIKLVRGEEEQDEGEAVEGFWPAVRTIVVADLVMSLDNVLAVAGAAGGNMVLLGLGLGASIPLVAWGGSAIAALLQRYPWLTVVGSAAIAVTACHMVAHDAWVAAHLPGQAVGWASLAAMALVGALGWRQQMQAR